MFVPLKLKWGEIGLWEAFSQLYNLWDLFTVVRPMFAYHQGSNLSQRHSLLKSMDIKKVLR